MTLIIGEVDTSVPDTFLRPEVKFPRFICALTTIVIVLLLSQFPTESFAVNLTEWFPATRVLLILTNTSVPEVKSRPPSEMLICVAVKLSSR